MAKAKPKEDVDWSSIEAEYLGTLTPVLQIAKRYGVSEGTIRHRAKKNGWTRDPAGLKRALVEKRLAGVTKAGSLYETRKAIEEQADKDAVDMELGLEVARTCLAQLLAIITSCKDPREIKIVAESNRIAIDTIRKIRGLDDPGRADLSKLSDEELEKMARGRA